MKTVLRQVQLPARRKLLLAGLAAAAMPLHAESGGLPMATALQQHLQQALGKGQPLVVMVSLHGCPFCRVAREHYLLPLSREQALPVVQVDMRSARSMRDFAGVVRTHDAQVRAWLGGPADVVMSDMAAASSGHRQTDHLRIIALCEAAAALAFDVLAPGGTFVAKVLAGGAEGTLQHELKRRFTRVANVKPPASRADSSEKFVVATGFRG
jgi:hypothetical protein